MLERIKDMLFTSQWYHNEDVSRLKMVTAYETVSWFVLFYVW